MFFLFWVGFWLFMGHSMAQGARIAGERDIAPAARRPSPVRAPTKAPAQPAKAKEEATQGEQKTPKGEKVTTEREKDSRYVTIDFDNVDIALFIKFISELTGKNFVIDKAVKGKVTIISPTKISVEEAYKVFESVLEVHGYTTVPAGKITKIVPAVEADAHRLLRIALLRGGGQEQGRQEQEEAEPDFHGDTPGSNLPGA